VEAGALSDKTVMAMGSQIFLSMLDWALPERCPCCGEITPAGGHFVLPAGYNLNFSGHPGVEVARHLSNLTGAMTPFARLALRERLAMTASGPLSNIMTFRQRSRFA
jgi:hypothetical protein